MFADGLPIQGRPVIAVKRNQCGQKVFECASELYFMILHHFKHNYDTFQNMLEAHR